MRPSTRCSTASSRRGPARSAERFTALGGIRGSDRALARRYSTGGAEPAAIEHLGSLVRDVFSTLDANLLKPPDQRLYDDTVVSVRLDRAALPLFRRLLRQRGAAFLEDVEGWVAEHESTSSSDAVRAGVIVQMFVDPESEKADEHAGPRPA